MHIVLNYYNVVNKIPHSSLKGMVTILFKIYFLNFFYCCLECFKNDQPKFDCRLLSHMQDIELIILCHVKRLVTCSHKFNIPVKILFQADLSISLHVLSINKQFLTFITNCLSKILIFTPTFKMYRNDLFTKQRIVSSVTQL